MDGVEGSVLEVGDGVDAAPSKAYRGGAESGRHSFKPLMPLLFRVTDPTRF